MQSPNEQRVERRLAAIFAADVAGYSRLMSQDEAGTLRALAAAREVMDGLIRDHGGRIANTAGDSVLAEFPSAVDAVQCAVAIQEKLAQANVGEAQDRQLQFRIGVHVGDVVVRGGDLLGDGVNVAARLEGLAEPGGVAISGAAHGYVRKALPLAYTDLGEQHVKNIDEPVRAYSLRATGVPSESAKPNSLPLPNKPSIAVLPFANMSGDPGQDYFTDGVTEEIITALTRIRWFFVIARNSSFTYRGRVLDVRQVARELGVRYVLTGSLRRSGNRIRITGQLVEAAIGCHLWADHYDGTLDDIFELQDRVAEGVVGAVEPKLLQVELDRARAKPTNNVAAYELYLRALWHFYPFTNEDNKAALGLSEQAVSRDPDFALAHALCAHLHVVRIFQNWSEDRGADLEVAARLARVALQKGGDDPRVLWRAALALVHSGYNSAACAALGERAVELSPSSAEAVAMSGWLQVFVGSYEIAAQRFERAKRLSPVEPMLFSFNTGLGLAYMFLGRLDLAIHWASEALAMSQRFTAAHRCLAAAHALSGNISEAKNVVRQLLQIDPGASVSSLSIAMRGTPKVDMYIRGLKLAGLPD